MSIIKPFKAIFYNLAKVKDFSKVVCPPYDVISNEERENYLNLSPFNFVYIDLGKEKLTDDKTDNKYTRAKETFEGWLQKSIMVQDETPSLYFYKQDYKVFGQHYGRLGFISLMELPDSKESRIYPHENTHDKAIQDRLKLCSVLKAQLSSIFVCFSDKQKSVEKIFNKHIVSDDPLVDVEDADHVRHRLWRLTDPDLIKEIKDTLSDQHLFIADGHHRFKMALEYRDLRLKSRSASSGQEPFNYVMTYFTNIDSKDLQILPMHRIVKHLPRSLEFLEEFFRIDKVKTREDLLVLLAQAGKNEKAFGLYTREGIKLLRLKNKFLVEENIHEGSSEYKNLDAVILKNLAFDKLGIVSEDIIYTKDFQQCISTVDNREAEASFILNPVKISQLKAIALNGEKMPPKTTYFYPKVLSGLTVYQME